MNDPKLYAGYNQQQRLDAEEFINEFEHHLSWQNVNGALLDIGSGSGDVLNDFLVPRLPKSTSICGIDISKEMINAAQLSNYGGKAIEFFQFDIADVTCNKKFLEKFDNITSFYCLHWVQDQQ